MYYHYKDNEILIYFNIKTLCDVLFIFLNENIAMKHIQAYNTS